MKLQLYAEVVSGPQTHTRMRGKVGAICLRGSQLLTFLCGRGHVCKINVLMTSICNYDVIKITKQVTASIL